MWQGYSLLDALRGRRSRRFGLGMKIDAGPFTYTSKHPPLPLSEDEEAALVFAACGITGYALADLAYGKAQGGNMLSGLAGRTVSSPDAINTVSLMVTNDDATYLVKRPQDVGYDHLPELVQLSDHGALTEQYRHLRIKTSPQRTQVPVEPGLNFNINKWSLYASGGTYFLPVNEMTAIYINALLEAFSPEMGLFIIDERNFFRPAGIGRFAASHGGSLDDNARHGRIVTVQGLELSLAEAVAVEQGMMLQNLGLMSQALGIGGFANYARSEYAWLQALGYRMEQMPSARYAGASPVLTSLVGLFGMNFPFPYAVGLERKGEVLLQAYSPPYYRTMREAVLAYVDHKFGPAGVFRGGAEASAWQQPSEVTRGIDGIPESAVEATIAYCEYIYRRYGRFPAYSAPFRTVIGYQATHVDVEFYDRFFRPEALTQTQRAHQHMPDLLS